MAKQKVAETYPDFQALLTEDDARQIERIAVEFGVNRRIALTALRRSREQLIKGSGQSAADVFDALNLCLDSTKEYIGHLESMIEMARTAQARALATMQTMVDRGMPAKGA